MSNQEQRLRELYPGFQNNSLTADELTEFLQLMTHGAHTRTVRELMDGTWTEVSSMDARPVNQSPVRSVSSSFRRLAVAAAILAALFVPAYFIFRDQITVHPAPGLVRTVTQPVRSNIAPGRNTALLTLGNGTQVVLDSVNDGTLASQGNTRVIKMSNGSLAYHPAAGSDEIVYNTLTTPRGGQYQVELPDGTKVWLNAASSLKFPTAFRGDFRTVELAGEAYFEVTKNPAMPFHVRTDGSEVQVIGTHFDVNSYHDEQTQKTTLLEGSIRLVRNGRSDLLVPGEQAQVSVDGRTHVVKDVDLDETVAWTKGYFQFTNATINEVMLQMSRWYDLDVEYEGQRPSGHFRGKISRSVYLNGMLKVIEASGVRFETEGKKLIVKS